MRISAVLMLFMFAVACQAILPEFSVKTTDETDSLESTESSDSTDTTSDSDSFSDSATTASASGDACGTDDDCASGHCFNEVCCDAGECCNASTFCVDGFACNTADFICRTSCMADDIDDNTFCASGFHCDSGGCFADFPAGKCDENSDCGSGECIGEMCCEHAGLCCQQSSECPELFDGCATDNSRTCVFSLRELYGTSQDECWNVNNDPVNCGTLASTGDYYGQDGHYSPLFVSSFVDSIHIDVIRDESTGKQWTAVPGSVGTWQSSFDYCAALSLAPGGWRLPTRLELALLMHYGTDKTTALPELFQVSASPSLLFWTSTPLAGQAGIMWAGDANVGTIFRAGVNNSSDIAVLCISEEI